MTLKINHVNAELILQDEIRRTEEARYDHRLHAVLLVAKGMNCPSAAKYLGDPERTVRHWVEKYNEEGLRGLVEIDKPGRTSRLTEQQLVKIDKILRRPPTEAGMKCGIWDGKTLSAYIENKFGISLGVRQCQRIFKHLGFRLRKPRSKIAHSNPELRKAFKKNSGD